MKRCSGQNQSGASDFGVTPRRGNFPRRFIQLFYAWGKYLLDTVRAIRTGVSPNHHLHTAQSCSHAIVTLRTRFGTQICADQASARSAQAEETGFAPPTPQQIVIRFSGISSLSGFSVMPAATTAGTGARCCIALAVSSAAATTGSAPVMPAAAVTGSPAAEDQGHDGMYGAAGNAMCDATEFFVQRRRSIGFRVFTATHDIPF